MARIKKASLTIEAAFVLPLFFLAFVTLITFMNAIGTQVSGNLTLSNKARKLAMNAAYGNSVISGSVLDGAWVDLQETKTFSFPFSMVPVPSLRIWIRARVYPWIGYKEGDDDASDSEDKDEEMVYVTDYKSVYHTHADCSHLDLTVIASTTDAVGKLRNSYGKKYRKCDAFPAGYTGTVYVTAKGDRYYPSLEYAGVTRHVRMVKKSEIGDLEECERCKALDGAEDDAA